ncbi:MAG: hypothetical protein EBE86_025475 [Hormoscilla sp. GUM202]|nr:hypothetical protein [Hormoscilla sp. GUM202]
MRCLHPFVSLPGWPIVKHVRFLAGDSHVNASLTAGHLAKAALQPAQPGTSELSFSIASYKRLALNEHLLNLFISLFDVEPALVAV